MEAIDIIKRPLVTEKSTWESSHERVKGKMAGEPLNRYSFEVDMQARKPEIRAAIEEPYKVRVISVNTQVRKGKYFRTRFGPSKTSNWKKAVVTLHPEDRIDLF